MRDSHDSTIHSNTNPKQQETPFIPLALSEDAYLGHSLTLPAYQQSPTKGVSETQLLDYPKIHVKIKDLPVEEWCLYPNPILKTDKPWLLVKHKANDSVQFRQLADQTLIIHQDDELFTYATSQWEPNDTAYTVFPDFLKESPVLTDREWASLSVLTLYEALDLFLMGLNDTQAITDGSLIQTADVLSEMDKGRLLGRYALSPFSFGR